MSGICSDVQFDSRIRTCSHHDDKGCCYFVLSLSLFHTDVDTIIIISLYLHMYKLHLNYLQ